MYLNFLIKKGQEKQLKILFSVINTIIYCVLQFEIKLTPSV